MGFVIEGGHMYLSDDSSSGSIGNAGAFGTRGPILFTHSGTFNITEYGLKVGDKVNVICIGGGGGGGGVISSAAENIKYPSTYGTGYGAGRDGGTCTGSSSDSYPYYYGGGGGGSGYVAKATVTLDTELIDVTIGNAGVTGGDSNDGSSGGTTSFGSLLSASGGSGGSYGSASRYANIATANGGAGGNNGSDSEYPCKEAAAGGNGYSITGTFTYATDNSTIKTADGACFIWY